MKNLKNTKKNGFRLGAVLGTFIIILSTLSSCDNALNEHVYGSVPANSFYKNQEQLQLALNGAYNGFWNTIYYNGSWYTYNGYTAGTLTRLPNPDEFNVFSWTSGNSDFDSIWSNTYEAINRTNTLLDKLAKSNNNISAEVIANDKGQAKFLRALYYYYLVRLFGGIPLYVHGTTGLSQAMNPRSSVDSVYQQIIADLQDANKELSPYSESDHTAGKATSGAAQALLVKVYAQRKEWTKAANAAEKVIDMGVFGLDDDYADAFDPSHNNDKENIFSVQHGNASNQNDKIGNHNRNRFSPGPETYNGTQIEFYHNSFGAVQQANQSFFDSTPNTYRKWQSMRDKMPYYYVLGSADLVRDTVALERPYVTKYYHLDTDTGYLKANVNAPIIRYSDVLLIYAEALNETNGGPTQEAYDAVNKVRARARGIGTSHEQPESVYPPLSGLSQSQFRDSVLAEEKREFVGEGHRRLDLLRHDMFISNAKSRGINASPKDTLFPIPSEQISRNPNLDQNPGYSR